MRGKQIAILSTGVVSEESMEN